MLSVRLSLIIRNCLIRENDHPGNVFPEKTIRESNYPGYDCKPTLLLLIGRLKSTSGRAVGGVEGET